MSFGMHIVWEQPQANHMQMYAARTPDGQWPAGDTCVRENTASQRATERKATCVHLNIFAPAASQSGALLDPLRGPA